MSLTPSELVVTEGEQPPGKPGEGILFAVIGCELEKDLEKKFLENKTGNTGVLYWSKSSKEAFSFCSEINNNGGIASVHSTPGGQLSTKTIKAILEVL